MEERSGKLYKPILNPRIVMKKMILICTLLTLIVGCASPRKYKVNRFTKQFQEADSMFNQKYLLK